MCPIKKMINVINRAKQMIGPSEILYMSDTVSGID